MASLRPLASSGAGGDFQEDALSGLRQSHRQAGRITWT